MSGKPILLDLYCKAGGAARGYQRAGFYVVGVDIELQPRYAGDEFVQADALTFPLDRFTAIHASPPCQAFTAYRRRGAAVGAGYPDLIHATRIRLERARAGVPYVIENVPGSPLRNYVQLCGTGFALDVQRHRWFESNIPLVGVPCAHGRNAPRFPQATNRHNRRRTVEVGVRRIPLAVQQQAMGIDWMTLEELTEAIPPAYTTFIGGLLMAALVPGRAATVVASQRHDATRAGSSRAGSAPGSVARPASSEAEVAPTGGPYGRALPTLPNRVSVPSSSDHHAGTEVAHIVGNPFSEGVRGSASVPALTTIQGGNS